MEIRSGQNPEHVGQRFGEIVCRRRRELGMSRAELAARIGWDGRAGDIARLETAMLLPSSVRVQAIAAALEMDVTELFPEPAGVG